MGFFIKRVIKSSIVAATTALISNVLNLDDTLVGRILGIAIPMITFFTADDKLISNKLFDHSKKREKGDRMTPEEGEEEFFDVFGEKGRMMSRFISKETGATEEEVNGVLGMTMSVMETGFSRVIREDDLDEDGFFKRFGDEAEEQKRRDPSLFKMFRKMVF
jgi:hypothetical protein